MIGDDVVLIPDDPRNPVYTHFTVDALGSMGVFLKDFPYERNPQYLRLFARAARTTEDTHRHHVEEHLGGAHDGDPGPPPSKAAPDWEPKIEEPAKDLVVLPHHYTRFKIEPIYFIAENNLDFMTGNVIKYVLRHDAKDGVQDLKKARRYLDMLIKKAEGDPAYAR